MRIGIIGAGWYGCHLGSVLLDRGLDVTIFEKNSRLLDGASGTNQYRLHLGFHYPRSAPTRMQSVEGFDRFMKRYPDLSTPILKNFYAVSQGRSVVDFPTYCDIMRASGLRFELADQGLYGFKNLEGMIRTAERRLNLNTARAHFDATLGKVVVREHAVRSIEERPYRVFVDGEAFDYVLDCTWAHFAGFHGLTFYYEPTIMLFYKTLSETPALTIMDGPFPSLYPADDGLWTLSSVKYTPLARVNSSEEATDVLDRLDSAAILVLRDRMEEEILRYFPRFHECFGYVEARTAVKTKPISASDNRACLVQQTGRIFRVFSGKIDTIFHAEDSVLRGLALIAPSRSPYAVSAAL